MGQQQCCPFFVLMHGTQWYLRNIYKGIYEYMWVYKGIVYNVQFPFALEPQRVNTSIMHAFIT